MVGRATVLTWFPERECGFDSLTFRFASVVKWTSYLASNEKVRVRLLAEASQCGMRNAECGIKSKFNIDEVSGVAVQHATL